jgi:hypothetical protein
LQGAIAERDAIIEKQKQKEEKLVIKMSQTILQKEQELEDARRELRFSRAPTVQEELNEVDKSILQNNGVKTTRSQGTQTLEISVGNERYITRFHKQLFNIEE